MNLDPRLEPLAERARQRGILARPVPESPEPLLILEHRGKRVHVAPGRVDLLGPNTLALLGHRAAALRWLSDQAVPTAPSLFTTDRAQARAFLAKQGAVVVKTADRPHAEGLTVGIKTAAALDEALAYAKAATADPQGRVLVQKHVEGTGHRLLVVGAQVYGVEALPASVEGTGEHTIRTLIEGWNLDQQPPRKPVVIDPALEAWLKRKGFTLETAPKRGVEVILSALPDLHRGGFVRDVTELLGDRAIAQAHQAAKAVGARWLQVDVVAEDITTQAGVIVGVDPVPDWGPFIAPSDSDGRDVMGALLDVLFG